MNQIADQKRENQILESSAIAHTSIKVGRIEEHIEFVKKTVSDLHKEKNLIYFMKNLKARSILVISRQHAYQQIKWYRSQKYGLLFYQNFSLFDLPDIVDIVWKS